MRLQYLPLSGGVQSSTGSRESDTELKLCIG